MLGRINKIVNWLIIPCTNKFGREVQCGMANVLINWLARASKLSGMWKMPLNVHFFGCKQLVSDAFTGERCTEFIGTG